MGNDSSKIAFKQEKITAFEEKNVSLGTSLKAQESNNKTDEKKENKEPSTSSNLTTKPFTPLTEKLSAQPILSEGVPNSPGKLSDKVKSLPVESTSQSTIPNSTCTKEQRNINNDKDANGKKAVICWKKEKQTQENSKEDQPKEEEPKQSRPVSPSVVHAFQSKVNARLMQHASLASYDQKLADMSVFYPFMEQCIHHPKIRLDWGQMDKPSLVDYLHTGIHWSKLGSNKAESDLQHEKFENHMVELLTKIPATPEWVAALNIPETWDNRTLLMECCYQRYIGLKVLPLLLSKFKVDVTYKGNNVDSKKQMKENALFIATDRMLNVSFRKNLSVNTKRYMYDKWYMLFSLVLQEYPSFDKEQILADRNVDGHCVYGSFYVHRKWFHSVPQYQAIEDLMQKWMRPAEFDRFVKKEC